MDLDLDDGWRMLTTQQHKYAYFRDDSHFREGWQTALDVLGDRAPAVLQRIAVVTVKPDAIIGRKVEGALDFMTANDFRPIHAETFSYDRIMTRELWRYQWNVATLDRLDLGDRVHQRSAALATFFLDVAARRRVPACTRLVPLKGSAFPASRHGDQLRTRLGAPNRILVLVHCPDEPIDIVRELAVMFDRERLVRLYTELGARVDDERTANLDEHIAQLYADCPAGTLSVEQARSVILAELAARAPDCPAATRAREALLAADAGQSLSWTDWQRDLRTCGIGSDRWEVVLVATHFVQHDVPGARCLVSRTGRQKWAAGEGRMIPELATT